MEESQSQPGQTQPEQTQPEQPQFGQPQSRQAQPEQIVTIARSDRWQVCYRLQELDISCTCPADGNLVVDLDTPVALAQLWSVMQQLTGSRQQMIEWLERCWQQA